MSILSETISIVKEASKIMMERDFSIKEKGDVSNIVTSSDIAVQSFLKERLTSLIPGSVFLGEEGPASSSLNIIASACTMDAGSGLGVESSEYIWVADPIDGTANFARNLSLSVISVALLCNREQTIGVVYHPYLDDVYYAEKGKGAFLNGSPIHVSERPFRSSMLCSAMSLYDKRFAKPCFEIIEKVYAEADDLRRLGTAALEMCELAAGRVDLYFEIRLSCWDYSAATLILKEAGGFFEIMFHDQIPFDKPAGIIAAGTESNFHRLKEIVYETVPAELY